MNHKRWPFLLVGVLTLAVFVCTGVYMMAIWDQLADMPPAERIAHRANHVYILFAALVNLAASTYGAVPMRGFRRILHVAGAILILISPALTVLAFILERTDTTAYRPWTMVATFAASFGVFAFAAGRANAVPPADSA